MNPFATEFEDSSESPTKHYSFVIAVVVFISTMGALFYFAHLDILDRKIGQSEQTYQETVDRLKQERCVKDSWKAKAWMDPKFWSEDEAMRWYELCLSR